jgi:hypothetical protein
MPRARCAAVFLKSCSSAFSVGVIEMKQIPTSQHCSICWPGVRGLLVTFFSHFKEIETSASDRNICGYLHGSVPGEAQSAASTIIAPQTVDVRRAQVLTGQELDNCNDV